MRFPQRSEVAERFRRKTVAVVGSGPGALKNPEGLIDSHDVVVRVNNYKLFQATGRRTDVFYSFFGKSIKKTPQELKFDGVQLCLCKCPDAQFIESAWHRQRGKMNGVDFRYIYELRRRWWFCDTYVPTVAEFLTHFDLLGGHVPTTGFSALLDVLSFEPAHVYMTGFDFFQSGVHNVNERWNPGDPTDPIGHVPDAERAWLQQNLEHLPVTVDDAVKHALTGVRMAPIGVPRRRHPRSRRRREDVVQ